MVLALLPFTYNSRRLEEPEEFLLGIGGPNLWALFGQTV